MGGGGELALDPVDLHDSRAARGGDAARVAAVAEHQDSALDDRARYPPRPLIRP